MATFFLMIIYLAFISLGLPDSLLGVAWPIMHLEIRAPLEMAGIISMVIAGGTIISSLLSGSILKRLSTGKVTFISCLMTACSLLGFYFAPSFIWLIILSVPLGLGAGSVDAALNSYVATHYKAHHMSWLHCFWGVGATIGPIIMSRYIMTQNSWKNGYMTVSIIQFILALILFLTLPLWEREEKSARNNVVLNQDEPKNVSNEVTDKNSFKIKGVKIALISFLFYCAIEATVGLWGSTFLVNARGINVATAAAWISMYYGGITFGRLISGFITMKFSNKIIIRMGQGILLLGVILILLPLAKTYLLIGFIMVGLGCAPIYPSMLHETPSRFGKENSQMIMGYQMAFAYMGSTFFPPILGWVASVLTIRVFPYFVVSYIMIMIIASEWLNIKLKGK